MARLLLEGARAARPQAVNEATAVPLGPESHPLDYHAGEERITELPASETEAPEQKRSPPRLPTVHASLFYH